MTLRKQEGTENEEPLDRTVWRTRFGRGYEPALRQTTAEMMGVPPSRCGICASCSTVSSASVRT